MSLCALFLTLAAYPPAKPTVGVIGGVTTTCGSVEVAVGGFQPGETVNLTLGAISGAVVIGTDGTGRITMSVPSTIGSYELSAIGGTSGLSSFTSVTLTACAVDPVVPTTTATTAVAVRGLPVSGSDATTPVRVALVVLGVGLALALFSRRRRLYGA